MVEFHRYIVARYGARCRATICSWLLPCGTTRRNIQSDNVVKRWTIWLHFCDVTCHMSFADENHIYVKKFNIIRRFDYLYLLRSIAFQKIENGKRRLWKCIILQYWLFAFVSVSCVCLFVIFQSKEWNPASLRILRSRTQKNVLKSHMEITSLKKKKKLNQINQIIKSSSQIISSCH